MNWNYWKDKKNWAASACLTAVQSFACLGLFWTSSLYWLFLIPAFAIFNYFFYKTMNDKHEV